VGIGACASHRLLQPPFGLAARALRRSAFGPGLRPLVFSARAESPPRALARRGAVRVPRVQRDPPAQTPISPSLAWSAGRARRRPPAAGARQSACANPAHRRRRDHARCRLAVRRSARTGAARESVACRPLLATPMPSAPAGHSCPQAARWAAIRAPARKRFAVRQRTRCCSEGISRPATAREPRFSGPERGVRAGARVSQDRYRPNS
jgi:hypothetical protein